MSTSAQSIVDAIDAAILAMVAGGGAQSITVEGRSITYQSLEDLRRARDKYAALADTTTNPRGLRISSIKFGGTP
jgi:hypothetical protein